MILFLSNIALSQSVADTLLSKKDISITKKLFIAPISLWQKLSYSTSAFNCQFEPSCSQFMALSISKHGTFAGSIIGADRIIRCNPFAHYYHTKLDSGHFHIDGRLLDTVPDKIYLHKPDINIAMTIVPGLGRLNNKHPGDGLYSFLLESTLAFSSYSLHRKGHPVGAIIFGTAAIVFWLSDFYDSLRIKSGKNKVK